MKRKRNTPFLQATKQQIRAAYRKMVSAACTFAPPERR